MELFFDFREQWLAAGLDAMRGKIEAAGYRLPAKVKVACGFPVGSRGGKKILAQCIAPAASADGTTEMFVSPTVADPLQALGCVLHEAGHACVGVEHGHGQPFKAFCAALGLVGKATEAQPGEACRKWLEEEVLPLLGAYPHAAVDPNARKKQGTRMIKLICPELKDDNGKPYTVRMTKKWLDKYGAPTSPAGCEMVIAEDEADE